MSRLREIRQEQGFTQKQLARKAGITERTIFSMEHGVPPRQDSKRRVLKALHIDWQRRAEVFG